MHITVLGQKIPVFSGGCTYVQRLRQLGRVYTLLGKGAYGKVWDLPRGHGVLKVARWNGEVHRNDPYVYYLAAGAAYPRNPLLPTIYDVRFFLDTHGHIWYEVHMEKLRPLNAHQMERWFQTWLGESYTTHPNNKALRSKVLEVVTRMYGRHHTLVEQLQEVLANAKRGSRGWLDLHAGNLMVRGRGAAAQLVVTDPLAPAWE